MVPSLLEDAPAPTLGNPEPSEAPDAPASDPAAGADEPETPATEPADGTPAPADGKPGQKDQPDKPAAAVDAFAELSLPQGSPLADADLAAVRDFATANALSLEQAKAVLTREHERAIAQRDGWYEQVDQWEAQIRADKEIGGDKLDVSKRHAQAALALFPPAARRLVIDSGYGHEPSVFRGLVDIGRRLAEPEKVVDGGGPRAPTGDYDDPVKLFPNSKSMHGGR